MLLNLVFLDLRGWGWAAIDFNWKRFSGDIFLELLAAANFLGVGDSSSAVFSFVIKIFKGESSVPDNILECRDLEGEKFSWLWPTLSFSSCAWDARTGLEPLVSLAMCSLLMLGECELMLYILT